VLLRGAAVRDTIRSTSRLLHDGQANSCASVELTIILSNDVWQRRQAYS
jgi:hypothetical protein